MTQGRRLRSSASRAAGAAASMGVDLGGRMGASLPQVTLASTTIAAAFPRRSLSSVLSGAVKVPTPALTTIAMEPHTHRLWRALRVPT